MESPPGDFQNLSRNEALEHVAAAQENIREVLASKGFDLSAITPEIGRDIAWTDVVRHVFRVIEFDSSGSIIRPDGTVEALSRVKPYGFMLVESPIMNQPAKLPIIHRDDLLLAVSVFDDPTMAEVLDSGELLVTYAPKRKLPKGLAGSSHALHFVITQVDTLERYYAFRNDLHMAYPDPEKLVGPFIYEGEIRVAVNLDPQL